MERLRELLEHAYGVAETAEVLDALPALLDEVEALRQRRQVLCEKHEPAAARCALCSNVTIRRRRG